MTIEEVFTQLETASHPVAKALYKGDNFKVLVIAFKKSMQLKKHVSSMPAKLTVTSGKIVYKQHDTTTVLQQFDEIDIPVNVSHSAEAKEDSLCLLIQE